MPSARAGGTVDLAEEIIPCRSTSFARSRVLPGNTRNSEHPSDRHADPSAAILSWLRRTDDYPNEPSCLSENWWAVPTLLVRLSVNVRQRMSKRATSSPCGGRHLSVVAPLLRDPDDFPNQPTHVPAPTPENRRGHPRSTATPPKGRHRTARGNALGTRSSSHPISPEGAP